MTVKLSVSNDRQHLYDYIMSDTDWGFVQFVVEKVLPKAREVLHSSIEMTIQPRSPRGAA